MLMGMQSDFLIQAQTAKMRARELGIIVGELKPGDKNAITDVRGVLVGQVTIKKSPDVNTGVTAILPHGGNLFREKVPAAVSVYNAYGKLTGSTQIEELGNIETPIILTNTLSVGTAVSAVVRYTLNQNGNENVRSVNAVVGETNDGYLNDIRGMHVTEEDVLRAIKNASSGAVEEGSVGAGTGTVAFGFKGGIGTSSRVVSPGGLEEFTVGVLVQTNFGRTLVLDGEKYNSGLFERTGNREKSGDGSCMIVIATDAPLSERNLKRMAKRAFAGMARTTTVMSNGSGDFAIAFSTAYRIPDSPKNGLITVPSLIANYKMTVFFQAVEEAVQEAIYNSIFMAETVTGYKGHKVEAFPVEKLRKNRNQKEK